MDEIAPSRVIRAGPMIPHTKRPWTGSPGFRCFRVVQPMKTEARIGVMGAGRPPVIGSRIGSAALESPSPPPLCLCRHPRAAFAPSAVALRRDAMEDRSSSAPVTGLVASMASFVVGGLDARLHVAELCPLLAPTWIG
jgi:hypothetical protein